MELIIRNTPELEAVCAQVKAAGILALDTEFVWTRTYRPFLGLVQIGTTDACWALDCLQGTKPQALGELIADDSIVKILHDARQDLEHLWHYTGKMPRNVFDTQCAAGFAGFAAGMGLQSLLMETIGVGLPKTETCTDWTQRPLTDAQVRYALDDVRYLAELRQHLLLRADALGTRGWLEEELAKYDNPALYEESDPREAWRRIKTAWGKLAPKHFILLQALAAARESTAREWNLPRNWLGDDESIVTMARTESVGHFRHRLRGHHLDEIAARYAAAIRTAKEIPPDDWPDDPHPHYLREVEDAADKALDWLRQRAEALHVAPSLVANRRTVTAFIDNPDDEKNPLANGWRFEVVGREMLNLFGC